MERARDMQYMVTRVCLEEHCDRFRHRVIARHLRRKVVFNALLGILVRQGKLDMHKPAPIAEWSAAPEDPRRAITPDQLLRMVSGIRCGQSLQTGFTTLFDADTQMEFDMADQSAFAANADLRAERSGGTPTAISCCCRG